MTDDVARAKAALVEAMRVVDGRHYFQQLAEIQADAVLSALEVAGLSVA